MVELIFWILVIPFLGYVAGGLYIMYLFKENTFFIKIFTKNTFLEVGDVSEY